MKAAGSLALLSTRVFNDANEPLDHPKIDRIADANTIGSRLLIF